MLSTPKWLGLLAVAFVAGTFVASPELRVYAANTVFSSDIVDGEVKTADLANNAVTAGKVKDGEIKAAEIAADSVGGSELIGVTKLLFGQCAVDSTEGAVTLSPGAGTVIDCTINGVDSDDSAIAQPQIAGGCFDARASKAETNQVIVTMFNQCSISTQIGAGQQIGIVVFDK